MSNDVNTFHEPGVAADCIDDLDGIGVTVIRGQNSCRGRSGRSPTFVPASTLYDVEGAERVRFRWSEWYLHGGGAL